MRIRNKLFITFLISGLLLTLLLLMLARWSIDRGMLDYVNSRERDVMMPVAERLGELYTENGSWDFLKRNPVLLGRLIRSPDLSFMFRPKHDDPDSRYEDHDNDHDDDHVDERAAREHRRGKPPALVLDKDKRMVLGPARGHTLREPDDFNLLPIITNDNTVGWLATKKRLRLTKVYERAFLEQQYRAFFFISMIVLVMAFLISIPLARHFLNPIRRITGTVSSLRNGEFVELKLVRRDELGELARDINELSQTLKRNKDIRDRWLADTSHELRTPVSILKGEIEAMLEGVRPIEVSAIESLRQEVEKLKQLIEDLNTLSNADIGGLRYQKEKLDLAGWLNTEVQRHQSGFQNAGVQLLLRSTSEPVVVFADPVRLTQLLDNLLENSLKYTNTGGRTEVDLSVADVRGELCAILTVSDSQPGVPDEALSHLFEHLYRVEGSRNRATGGSGLGLAICERIVEGHQGTIVASHSRLGGLSIQVNLPMSL